MRNHRRSEAGFTVVESLIVLGTLTVAILGVLGAHVTCASLNRTNHESVLAGEAIRMRMEQIAATDIAQVMPLYDSVTTNDPAGTGTAPGATFSLGTLAADSLGRQGTIEMPASGGQIREDVVNAAIGMPRDLNGDGTIDALNHTTDFKVLPVLVRFRWKGANGDREMRLPTVLYR